MELLISKRRELVSREEIIAKLWGQDVFIETEHSINTAIRKIRQTLGDDPERSRFVQTVVGKGYRFVGPINAVDASPAVDPSSPPVSEIEEETRRSGQKLVIRAETGCAPILVFRTEKACLHCLHHTHRRIANENYSPTYFMVFSSCAISVAVQFGTKFANAVRYWKYLK